MKPLRYSLAFVFVLILSAGSASATTYYIGPNGSDSNSGTSVGSPLGSFSEAVSRLDAGDTLILLDGNYYPNNNEGRLVVDDKYGSSSNPITIKARNERQAHLDGNGYLPMLDVQDSQWIVVKGLRVSGQDNSNAQNGNVSRVVRSENVTLRRMIFDHNNRYENSGPLSVLLSQHVLVVESEMYYFHRNGFSAFKSNDVTFRRCYANSRGYSDINGGRGSHRISQDGGDASYVGYYTNNLTVENSISEYKNEGFDVIAGKDDVTGTNSGLNPEFYGNISIDDNRTFSFQSRDKGTGPQAIRNARVENFLQVRAQRKGFISRAVESAVVENVTAIDGSSEYYNGKQWDGDVFTLNFDRQSIAGGSTIYPSCANIGGCDFDLRNFVVANNDGDIFESAPPNGSDVDILTEYGQFYNNGSLGLGDNDVSDNSGQVQHSAYGDPTGIGVGQGECAVFVPNSSNMSGAGKNGADKGANILYRYEDGQLTNQPLWDANTGEFPHGAIIQGGINDPSQYNRVPANVHQRLNVNTNGCTLPYSNNSTLLGETGEVYGNWSDGEWKTLNFDRTYSNPVVIMQPASFGYSNPAIVRVRNIGSGSTKYRLSEWDYGDGGHANETIGYGVFESGTGTFGGQPIDVSTVGGVHGQWKSVSFNRSFSSPPVVLAQGQEDDLSQAFVTRIRNVTANGFEVRLQEQEANSDGHEDETIGYVAIGAGTGTARLDFEAGVTANTVHGYSNGSPNFTTINFNSSFSNDPVFLANMQTFDGGNPAGVRYQNNDHNSAQVFVEEEQSADNEQAHTSEVVGYLVFDSEGYLGGPPSAKRERASAPEAHEGQLDQPKEFALEPAYPNPFRRQATLPLHLPEAAEVHAEVYDVMGRRVATLADGQMAAGRRQLHLSATDLPSGLYVIRARVEAPKGVKVFTRKITLVR